MSDKKRYYFDTNALYKHYIFEQQPTTIHELSDNHHVFISNLTYLEMLNVLMRHVRTKKIRRKSALRVMRKLEEDIGTTPRHRFQLVAAPEGIFRTARVLIAEYAVKYELSTNDALHIAIAKSLDPAVIMVTSDGGKGAGKMKGVCAEIKLVVFDPETKNLASELRGG